MARKKLAWAELRVGILVLASFTILALAIVLISGEAGFFTPKYTLRTYLPSASGLRKGSLVWVAGIEVGNVDAVNITSSPDPNKAVEVIMKINEKYRDAIREDSSAVLGSIGLLGDKYVDISRGSTPSKPIPTNGEIKGFAEADIKKIIQNSNDLVANLGDLVTKINQITNKIDVGQGTLGKIINDPSMFNKMNATVDRAQDLLLQIKSGEGSIGKFISDRDFYDRMNGTIARVDNVVAKIEGGEGTLGKFLNDPAVFNRADELLTRFNVVAARIESGEGFLGKLSKDDALYGQFRDTLAKYSLVAERVTQGEGTIGKLFTDPSLYSNLNSASAEVVKLMYDFRQNPKRFLRIKVGLF
jgi:phospholipid/cholesterol/gamma-HCH transport system substrate-binding protein